MESYVVSQQGPDGTRRFLAPYNTPPWTTDLTAAEQYTRRWEAEGDAREFSASVLTWREAHDLAFSPLDAVGAVQA